MVVESRAGVGENVGWRIDYQIATPALAATANRCGIYKLRRFSDHAPLTIDYDYTVQAAAPAVTTPTKRAAERAPRMPAPAVEKTPKRAALG